MCTAIFASNNGLTIGVIAKMPVFRQPFQRSARAPERREPRLLEGAKSHA